MLKLALVGSFNNASITHSCGEFETSLPRMSMSQQQIAGHLGVANNPQCSQQVQHASRQAVMDSAARGNSGRSQSSIAGQIGVTTNPQVSSSGQHAARQAVMKDAGYKK